MKIEHNIETIVLFDDNKKEVGELKYKIVDNEVVLMGTFINKIFRGNGYFNILFGELVNNHRDKVIYVCCVEKFIFKSIEKFGFRRINETIPHWGMVSNGVNFKYIPKI